MIPIPNKPRLVLKVEIRVSEVFISWREFNFLSWFSSKSHFSFVHPVLYHQSLFSLNVNSSMLATTKNGGISSANNLILMCKP